jgi:hypothetical protein
MVDLGFWVMPNLSLAALQGVGNPRDLLVETKTRMFAA